MLAHPLLLTAAAGVAGILIAAWILRHEARYQLRHRRHIRGGYLIGGDR